MNDNVEEKDDEDDQESQADNEAGYDDKGKEDSPAFVSEPSWRRDEAVCMCMCGKGRALDISFSPPLCKYIHTHLPTLLVLV